MLNTSPADLSPDDQRALAAYADLIREAQTPALATEIGFWCEFVLSRYRARPDTPVFADLEKHVWLTVLGHWPLAIMQAAVVAWCAEARPFPPAVAGELLVLGQPIYARRATTILLIEHKLEVAGFSPRRALGAPAGAPAAETLGPVTRLAGSLSHG